MPDLRRPRRPRRCRDEELRTGLLEGERLLGGATNVDGKGAMVSRMDAMASAIDETSRRRTIQEAFNQKHGITPKSVKREIREFKAGDEFAKETEQTTEDEHFEVDSIPAEIVKLKAEMKKAATALEFEEAASLRDRVRTLENLLLKLG